MKNTMDQLLMAALAIVVPLGAFAAAGDYATLQYIYMEGGATDGQANNTATHYIDTGVVPTGAWSIEAAFASTNTAALNTVYSALFCARGASNANAFMFWPHIGTVDHWGRGRIDIGSAQTASHIWQSGMGQEALAQGVRHTVAIKESSDGRIAGYFDGVRITDEYAPFGSTTCPLYLFSAYTGAASGKPGNIKFSFEGWFFGLTARDGDGNLRLDLVPARRLADGAVGVYDRANDQFFTNQGSGAFVAGPDALAVARVSRAGGQYKVAVYADATRLKEGTDYTFAVTDAAGGVKKVAITGIGDYAGITGSAKFHPGSPIDGATYAELDGISMAGASHVIPARSRSSITPRGDWTFEMGFKPLEKTGDYATYGCLLSARRASGAGGNAVMFWSTAAFNIRWGRYGRFDYEGNSGLPATANATSGPEQGTGPYKQTDESVDTYGDIALSGAYGADHVFLIENGVQSLDGATVYDASDATDFTCGGQLVLFASSTGDTVNVNHAPVGTFRYLSIADANGGGILDMVPARRLSDGVAGIYDAVNDAFYASAGTEAFSAGEALVPYEEIPATTVIMIQ